MPGFDDFILDASWDDATPRPLQTWTRPQGQNVMVGEGAGQNSSPFSVTAQVFSHKCSEIGFSRPFLDKLVSRSALFEYRFVFPGSTDSIATALSPSHLEIAMATYENDAFFCLFRYGLVDRKSDCLLFLKTGNHLKKNLIEAADFIPWLDNDQEILQRHPLLILNVILVFIQDRAHDFLRWRLELNDMESRLGVTRDGSYLRSSGYAAIDHDFTLLNADLAGIVKKAADTELSASTVHEHAKSIQRLIGICEDLETPSNNNSVPRIFSVQREEIQSTIIRAELYLKHMKMTKDVLQSLTAVLYNRISKQDTDSMKTIAVVTLVFLPATFVSAIFSTGIFNFHATESPDNPRIVSRFGWVYLLACVLSTALTLISWSCWYRWGRVWLEKLNFSRIHLEGRYSQDRKRSLNSEMRKLWRRGVAVLPGLMRLPNRSLNTAGDVEAPSRNWPAIPGEELRNPAMPDHLLNTPLMKSTKVTRQ